MQHETYATIAIPLAHQASTARNVIAAEIATLSAFVFENCWVLLGANCCISCSRKCDEESEDCETHGC